MLSNDSLSHENTKVNGNKNKISSPSSGGSDNSNTMSLPNGTAYNPTLLQNKSSVNNNYMQSNKNKSSQLEPQLIKFNSQRRSKVENTRLSELSNKSYHYGNKMSSKNSVNDVIDENRDLVDDAITTQDIQNLRSIGRKSINDFTSEDIQKSEKWARKFYKELGTKSPFFRAWFGDWRAYDTGKLEKIREVSIIGTKDVVKTTDEISKLRKEKKLPIGNYKNNDSNFIINIGTQVYDDTLTYANREYSRDKNFQNYLLRVSLLFKIDDIVKNSILLDTEIIDKSKNNYRTFMHTFYNVVEIDNKSYLIKLKVDELLSYNGVIRRAYNLNKIEMSPVAVSQVYKPADTTSDNSSTFATIYNISDLFSFVKQYDKEFNPKPVNPVMLNDDGTPKVFYHSTNENFTVFKKGERAGLSGKGIYFSPYQQNIYGRNSMPVYLKIENPMTKANEPDGAREKNSSGFKTKIIPDFFEKYPEYDAIIQRDEVVVKNPNQIKSATDNIGTFDGNNPDIRYSKDDKIDFDDKKITIGMSDSERAEILKNTVLTLADYEDAKKKVGKTVDTATVLSLQDTVRNNAYKILRVLGDKFKVFEKIYKNKNVNLEFDYSKGTLKESVNKQGNISTDYSDFAKMLCVFDEIVNNAVPIEVHTDRYAGTERHNPDLKYDYVLLSGFKDKEYIIPVELHIKEYFVREPNKLYVSITLGKTKIEDNVVAVTTEPEKDSVRNTARLSSKVSLPQLISKVNSPYGNFYKYIPDELLNENQLALKAESLQDEEKMLSDLRKKNISDTDVLSLICSFYHPYYF